MSDRTSLQNDEAAQLDSPSSESADRRSISIYALFAVDEPEADDEAGVGGDIVAFLPGVCATPYRAR